MELCCSSIRRIIKINIWNWLFSKSVLQFVIYTKLIYSFNFLCIFFMYSLTVHISITLANDQLDAQIFNTFITILYMFRSISCSSSGGQIVLILILLTWRICWAPNNAGKWHMEFNSAFKWSIQHLASLSVIDRPVLCTGRSITESDDSRCCINTIWHPEDEQDIARNM